MGQVPLWLLIRPNWFCSNETEKKGCFLKERCGIVIWTVKTKVEKNEISMQTRFEVYRERIKCLTKSNPVISSHVHVCTTMHL